MSVITISRGSHSYGKAIAEEVSKKLGYACLARDVLLEASREFNLPEFKLLSAIKDAPSILDRFVYGKEKYLAFTQAALLKRLREDCTVYHGFAGHFLVRDIPHVLKVRINADMEDRVKILRAREELSEKEAYRNIRDIDKQRKKWSRHLYGVDTWSSSLYDLVIQIGKVQVKDAVNIICSTVGLERFQSTPESQKAMEDLYLAANVKASLINLKRDIQVSVRDGVVHVKATTQESKELKLVQDIEKIVSGMPGVKVHIDVISVPFFPDH